MCRDACDHFKRKASEENESVIPFQAKKKKKNQHKVSICECMFVRSKMWKEKCQAVLEIMTSGNQELGRDGMISLAFLHLCMIFARIFKHVYFTLLVLKNSK